MIYLTEKQVAAFIKQIASQTVKDTDLPTADRLQEDDYVAIVQNGINKKIDAALFKTTGSTGVYATVYSQTEYPDLEL